MLLFCIILILYIKLYNTYKRENILVFFKIYIFYCVGDKSSPLNEVSTDKFF